MHQMPRADDAVAVVVDRSVVGGLGPPGNFKEAAIIFDASVSPDRHASNIGSNIVSARSTAAA